MRRPPLSTPRTTLRNFVTVTKTSDERLRQGLEAIRVHVGQAEMDYIDEELARGPRLRYAPRLEMGSYDGAFRNKAEREKRNAIRGLILTGLVLGRIKDIDVTPTFRQELLDTPLEEIVRRMKRAFPFRAFSGRYSNLDAWDPANFTTPAHGVMNSYRFIVHGIMADPSKVANREDYATKAEWDAALDKWDASIREVKKAGMNDRLYVNFAAKYLADPAVLRSTIISTSVISEHKHATYYPFGFILKVPVENVYSASSKDQSVANRTADAVAELARVYTQKGGGTLLTPNDVLDGTTGANGNTGYNEVVVVGRSPEGQEVSVIGIFVKIAPNGNFYVPPGRSKPYVTPELWALVKAQHLKGMPVVQLVDTSSAASTAAVAF